MTSKGYFGKMNSTLGSVVPLAMFFNFEDVHSLTNKGSLKLVSKAETYLLIYKEK